MLALFDSLFIICMTISFCLPILFPTYGLTIHPWVFPWLLPAIQISLNGSIWSTVAVAVERFSSVVCSQQNGR
jgi:hypothetical protein